MNDAGYGVIRNIQDADYGGRRCYTDLHMADFEKLAQSMGLAYSKISRIEDSVPILQAAAGSSGPVLVEVDMTAIGPYAAIFAGPPVRK
jgi:acetolactate synthase I/II/III large subunit